MSLTKSSIVKPYARYSDATNCSARCNTLEPGKKRKSSSRLPGGNWIVNGDNARTSTTTYASTITSHDDVEKDYIEAVCERYESFPSHAVASTPPTFADLFPSGRRLLIKHDDTTRDGNLNLRISTLVTESRGRQCEIILFHLRMMDLEKRKFSLRRYCRQSGREVCHSSRKYEQDINEKRCMSSWATAFSPFRTKFDSPDALFNHLRRQDSGYKSGVEDDGLHEEKTFPLDDFSRLQKAPIPTNIVKLDFSNYAHVDVKRKGSRVSKRYDYEYWSTKYQWRRSIRCQNGSEEVSYHLYDLNRPKPVAHIIPDHLTPMAALVEESKGGWIPPSSFCISDSSIFGKMSDIADVVIATGLVVLVDDNIKRRWHKPVAQPSSSIASTFMKSMESLISTRFFDKVFQRHWSSGSQHLNSVRQLVLRGYWT
ncbi:hypothetical protein LOZ51_005813 [Ophidiomyces ophidiicola]|nr:hypothetical protein LOZ55_003110 [Ophidiomyces ophidiicola]KAI1987042.1 hypothetical protein LOZ51_005813 [Ophidiomyces ophidiicola]KAI1989030.1 hypothetical protein LOZ54_003035 [Ophidiomyces ophidiicola]